MKRDHELVRNILLRIEESDSDDVREAQLRFDGVDPVAVGYHVQLLEDAGFIEATIIPLDRATVPMFVVERLTWQGHEFLDNVRDPKVWAKAQATIGEKLTSVGVELVARVAAEIVKAQLGIA